MLQFQTFRAKVTKHGVCKKLRLFRRSVDDGSVNQPFQYSFSTGDFTPPSLSATLPADNESSALLSCFNAAKHDGVRFTPIYLGALLNPLVLTFSEGVSASSDSSKADWLRSRLKKQSFCNLNCSSEMEPCSGDVCRWLPSKTFTMDRALFWHAKATLLRGPKLANVLWIAQGSRISADFDFHLTAGHFLQSSYCRLRWLHRLLPMLWGRRRRVKISL